MTVPSGKLARLDKIMSSTSLPIPRDKYNLPVVSVALYDKFRTTCRSGRMIVHSTTFTIAFSREIELEFDLSICVRAQPYKEFNARAPPVGFTCETFSNNEHCQKFFIMIN